MIIQVGDIIWRPDKLHRGIFEITNIEGKGNFFLKKLYDPGRNFNREEYKCKWTIEEQSKLNIATTTEAAFFRLMLK